MKKTILIIPILLFCWSLNSCKNANGPTKDNENANDFTNRVTSFSFSSIDDFDDMPLDQVRQIFRLASPQERCDMWKEKLNRVSSLSLSQNQRDLVQEIHDELTPDCFDWGSPKNQQFQEVFLPSLSVELESEFSDIQGLNVFYLLHDIDDINNSPFAAIPDDEPSGLEDCDCDYDSFFGGCQVLGNSCDEAECGSSNRGCGFMGIWKCDGSCDDAPQPAGDVQLYH
jgi:hypothetical protein